MLLVTIILGLAADLGSKHAAFEHIAGSQVVVQRAEVLAVMQRDPHALQSLIPRHTPRTVVPHVLDLQLVLNPGAVFGMGAGQRWGFVGFTGVAIVFALVMFARWRPHTQRGVHIGIGLIIAGGIGNLYDRLVFACVRDFLHPLPTLRLPFGLTWPSGERLVWPYVSNVADALLIAGVVLLFIGVWRAERAPVRAREAVTAESPTNT